MPTSEQKLIEKLRVRNLDRERATSIPRSSFHAIKNLQIAERALGFKLPELVRAIYLKVGNGGFGPSYGIVGTKGGFKLDNHTLESCYQRMLQLESDNSVWRWPERLLPLANYGCGMWSCADCAYKKLPMVLWDPNNLDSELDRADARINWANAFWDQGQSLGKWLEGWLAGKPEPEPKWPSDSWITKRLGFRLPKSD